MKPVVGSQSAARFDPVADPGDSTASVIEHESPSVDIGGDESPGPDDDRGWDLGGALNGQSLGGVGHETPARLREPARGSLSSRLVGCRDGNEDDLR